MPEFLEKRFSPTARSFLSIISLVSYVLTKVAVTVYAGGVVFKQVLGIESWMGIDFFWIGAIGLVIVTGLYTVLGGMKSVLYTSVLQTPVLLVGSIMILIVGLIKVGGWGELAAIAQTHVDAAGRQHAEAGTVGAGSRISMDRRAVRFADHRLLVLVHRPVHRAACSFGPQPERGAAGHDVRRLSQAAAGVHFSDSRHDRLCPEPKGHDSAGQSRRGFPDAGFDPAAGGHEGHCRGRPGRGADELAGLAVQLFGHCCSPSISTRNTGPTRARNTSSTSDAWQRRWSSCSACFGFR